ncbi:MAG: hypothetical protein JO360_16940 [Acidobacteria bacterium]|nr:hypothetical protein [Acidobacteriota bacterium]
MSQSKKWKMQSRKDGRIVITPELPDAEANKRQLSLEDFEEWWMKKVSDMALSREEIEDKNVATNQSTELVISAPPKRAEQALLLMLSKEEREHLIGDLAEEYSEIESIHGERFANLWYSKQAVASAWPLIWKALRWGVWASIGAWIRRII